MDHPIVLLNFLITIAASWYAAKAMRNGWWLLLIIPVICAMAVGLALAIDLALGFEPTSQALDTAAANSLVGIFIGTVWSVWTRLRKWAAEARYRSSPHDPRGGR